MKRNSSNSAGKQKYFFGYHVFVLWILEDTATLKETIYIDLIICDHINSNQKKYER